MTMPQTTATIGFEQLSKYFHLPINDVAKELGICATMLKKICRRNGIPRWPHRKIKSINKMIENLESTLQSGQGEAEECVRQEIVILKNKKSLIMKNPAILASTTGSKRSNSSASSASASAAAAAAAAAASSSSTSSPSNNNNNSNTNITPSSTSTTPTTPSPANSPSVHNNSSSNNNNNNNNSNNSNNNNHNHHHHHNNNNDTIIEKVTKKIKHEDLHSSSNNSSPIQIHHHNSSNGNNNNNNNNHQHHHHHTLTTSHHHHPHHHQQQQQQIPIQLQQIPQHPLQQQHHHQHITYQNIGIPQSLQSPPQQQQQQSLHQQNIQQQQSTQTITYQMHHNSNSNSNNPGNSPNNGPQHEIITTSSASNPQVGPSNGPTKVLQYSNHSPQQSTANFSINQLLTSSNTFSAPLTSYLLGDDDDLGSHEQYIQHTTSIPYGQPHGHATNHTREIEIQPPPNTWYTTTAPPPSVQTYMTTAPMYSSPIPTHDYPPSFTLPKIASIPDISQQMIQQGPPTATYITTTSQAPPHQYQSHPSQPTSKVVYRYPTTTTILSHPHQVPPQHLRWVMEHDKSPHRK